MINNNINKKAPLRLLESMQPSRVRSIRKKMMIEQEPKPFGKDVIWRKLGYVLKLQLEGPLFERLSKIFKKLVSVLATYALITRASKEDEVVLKKVPCLLSALLLQE